MEQLIISLMDKYGYLGIFLLILLENIFPPIPSEVILTFSGYMITYTSLNLILIILFSTLGSLLGAILLYFLGKIISLESLYYFSSSKLGKLLCINEKDVNMTNQWFSSHGNSCVFFGRFIPIIRSLISIPAGINRMNLFKFSLFSFLGSLIWNSVLILLGNILGNNFTLVVDVLKKYSNITLILMIIFLIVFTVIKKRRKINN